MGRLSYQGFGRSFLMIAGFVAFLAAGCSTPAAKPKPMPSLRGVVELRTWIEFLDEDMSSSASDVHRDLVEECRTSCPGLTLSDGRQEDVDIDEWGLVMWVKGVSGRSLSGRLFVYKPTHDDAGRMGMWTAYERRLEVKKGSWDEQRATLTRRLRDFAMTWQHHQDPGHDYWTCHWKLPPAEAWCKRIALLREGMSEGEVRDVLVPWTPQEFSTIYNRTSLPDMEQKALFPEKWPHFGNELKTGELHEWDYFVQRDGKDVGFVGVVIKDGKLIGVYSNWPEAILGGQTPR
jgi:hypothetical protein